MPNTSPQWSASMALMLKYQRVRITLDELANELGRARNTLYNELAAGTLCVPTYIEGRTRYADVRDVGAYLDAQRNAALAAFESAQRERRD